MSSRVADACINRPLQSTSTPANNALETKGQESNAVTVITRIDAAKIRHYFHSKAKLMKNRASFLSFRAHVLKKSINFVV